MDKLNEIKEWISEISEISKRKKVSILMNDHISGFIASKIAIDIFGKDNVVNVVIPCYSSTDYILNAAKFSNEKGVKYKNIGIKHVYDSIMEQDIEDDSINIVDFLRDQIMSALSINNNTMVIGFHQTTKNQYVFMATFLSKEYFNTGRYVKTESWDSLFTEEDLNEIAKILEINEYI